MGRKLFQGRKPKASNTPGSERRAPEPAWTTAEGYRLVDRLVALDPGRPGADRTVTLAHEIIDQHIRLGRRGLAVCGAARFAGATFSAANLAIGLAQAGVSTLLVDADLEEPGVQDLIIPPEPGAGLRQLFADGSLSLAGTIHQDVVPGLAVLYAGPQDDGLARTALGSDRCREVVQQCLRDYECAIFDTSPANRSPDSQAIAAIVGYALLVARRNRSFADDLQTLATQLNRDEVHIVGSVFNGA